MLVVLEVLFAVFAPAGRGGEGSSGWRWLGAGAGGSWRGGAGWLLDGGGKLLLWSSAFIEARFRRLRRTASTTVYKAWWWLLPGSWRYGVSGDV